MPPPPNIAQPSLSHTILMRARELGAQLFERLGRAARVARRAAPGGHRRALPDRVQSLQIGASLEGGLAVVVLAIYLDRVSAALGGQGRAVG